MTEKKKQEEKAEENTEQKKAPAPKEPKKEDAGRNLSPNEDKSLPQGIYGGPATIDNPPKECVVVRAEDRN